MTLPRELVLRENAGALRLSTKPVKELESLREKKFKIKKQSLYGTLDLTKQLGVPATSLELVLEMELPNNAKTDFAVVLSNTKGETYRIGFDAAKNEFYSDRRKAGNLGFSDKFAIKRHVAPRSAANKTLKMHLFFDVASCELFADDGAVALTDIFFPTEDFSNIQLVASNGAINLKSSLVYTLKPSW